MTVPPPKRRPVKVLRTPRTRRSRPPITVRFACRHCGLEHPTHAHDLDPVAQLAEVRRLQEKARTDLHALHHRADELVTEYPALKSRRPPA